MSPASTPSLTVRHVALARALFAAIAAVMITFTSDHSAEVGLSVFSGFAIATMLVWAIAAWLVYPSGRRTAPVLLALVSLAAGITAGMTVWRSPILFFVLVIAWAILTGVIEGVWGLRERKTPELRAAAREAMTMGGITVVFGLALLVVPIGYELQYSIEVNDAPQEYTLTGIIIAVGIFGAYAAIVAVYQAINGFSPQRATQASPVATSGAETTIADDATAEPAASGKADE